MTIMQLIAIKYFLAIDSPILYIYIYIYIYMGQRC